jgi:hypothetical protein
MDGICSDMHFSSNITPKPETNNLTPHEIQEVLNTVLDNYKLDVLGLDACSMSALEVAYEFKDYADTCMLLLILVVLYINIGPDSLKVKTFEIGLMVMD